MGFQKLGLKPSLPPFFPPLVFLSLPRAILPNQRLSLLFFSITAGHPYFFLLYHSLFLSRRRVSGGGCLAQKTMAISLEHVRPSGASDGSEPEHRVVHVPGRVDDLHPHHLLLMDHRTLRPQLLLRHGLDHRPPPPFLRNPLSPISEYLIRISILYCFV
jgi:hypothetical protein